MSDEFAKKGYNESLLQLFSALNKRGYNRPNDPKFGAFEMYRQLTLWTGQVYPAQQDTLKRNGVLIGDSPVTITMDTNTKKINFLYQTQGTLPYPVKLEKLKQVVTSTLGTGWEVTTNVAKNGKTNSG